MCGVAAPHPQAWPLGSGGCALVSGRSPGWCCDETAGHSPRIHQAAQPLQVPLLITPLIENCEDDRRMSLKYHPMLRLLY